MTKSINQIEDIIETVDSNMLIVWGGVFKNYDKDEYIFQEGQHPHFYHQVVEGRVKMLNESDDGKEFIQGFFTAGQSFGEPPIFDESEYPASAKTDMPSVIIRLHIATFMQMLKDNFDIHLNITTLLAHRLKNKANNLKEISCHNPEHRILSILNNYKKDNHYNSAGKAKIEFTRQEIADMSGLRVETVIRAMRTLHDKKKLTIEHGKVFY
jgi:CRP/FNR family transcriptional regulator, cyclic AMP receptor protein